MLIYHHEDNLGEGLLSDHHVQVLLNSDKQCRRITNSCELCPSGCTSDDLKSQLYTLTTIINMNFKLKTHVFCMRQLFSATFKTKQKNECQFKQ